jgi:predicted RNA binding protein YcfA (HicA-like mRNA interferase family)
MPKGVPSLKPRRLIQILESAGCKFHREGKGDHKLYVRRTGKEKRVVPIDMGQGEFSPPYVLRILRQFGFSDQEIEALLK